MVQISNDNELFELSNQIVSVTDKTDINSLISYVNDARLKYSELSFGYIRISKLFQTRRYRLKLVQTFGYQYNLLRKYNIPDKRIFVDWTSDNNCLSLSVLNELVSENDTIICSSIDRIGLSFGECACRIKDLNKRKISVITASDGSVYEKKSVPSVLLKNMYEAFVLADEERKRIDLLERAKMMAQYRPNRFGRPANLTLYQQAKIVEMIANGVSLDDVTHLFNVSPRTVRKIIDKT